MCNREDFLRYADRCDRIVEDSGVSPQYCDDLKTMARGWRHLAAEEERIARLIGEIDLLLLDPLEANALHAFNTWSRIQ